MLYEVRKINLLVMGQAWLRLQQKTRLAVFGQWSMVEHVQKCVVDTLRVPIMYIIWAGVRINPANTEEELCCNWFHTSLSSLTPSSNGAQGATVTPLWLENGISHISMSVLSSEIDPLASCHDLCDKWHDFIWSNISLSNSDMLRRLKHAWVGYTFHGCQCAVRSVEITPPIYLCAIVFTSPRDVTYINLTYLNVHWAITCVCGYHYPHPHSY